MPQPQQEIYFPTPCAYLAALFFRFSQTRSTSAEPLPEKCESPPATEIDWQELRESRKSLAASLQIPHPLPNQTASH